MYNREVTNQNDQKKLEQLRTLSVLLDSRFEGPFGIRFGLDGILGFVPFIGDIVTTSISIFILIEGARLGATPATLVRMSLNIFFENLIDMIPVLGSFFDIFWKSNNRNMKILDHQLAHPEKTSRVSRAILLLFIAALLILFFAMAYVSWMILQLLVGLLS